MSWVGTCIGAASLQLLRASSAAGANAVQRPLCKVFFAILLLNAGCCIVADLAAEHVTVEQRR